MVAARPALPSMSKRPITPVPQRGTTDSRAPARLELSSGSKELQRESCSLSSRMKFRQVGKRRCRPGPRSTARRRSAAGASASTSARSTARRCWPSTACCWSFSAWPAMTAGGPLVGTLPAPSWSRRCALHGSRATPRRAGPGQPASRMEEARRLLRGGEDHDLALARLGAEGAPSGRRWPASRNTGPSTTGYFLRPYRLRPGFPLLTAS